MNNELLIKKRKVEGGNVGKGNIMFRRQLGRAVKALAC